MFPTLSIGPFVFPTAGLVYIFGAWLTLTLVERAAKRLNTPVDVPYGVAVAALFGGFIGARLAFVFQYWPAYQENLINIVWPLTSGFNAPAGLFFALVAGFFYGRYKKANWLTTLDALAPGIILAVMVVSLADFLAGPGFGTLTAVPWGISQFGIRRHPVQIYELLVGALALLVWWSTIEKRTYPGQLFLFTITTYSAGRLFVDAFRDNPWITGGGLHIIQIICFIIMVVGLFLLGYFSDEAKRTPSEKAAE